MTEPNACPSPLPCPFCGREASVLDYSELGGPTMYGCSKADGDDCPAHSWASLEVWNRRASSASAGATPEPHPLRDWNLLSRETQDHDCTLGAEAMIDEHLPVLTHSVRWHLAQRCLRAVSRGGSSGATGGSTA